MLSLIFIIFCISIAASTFYRLGGEAGYDTKFRDFGIPWLATVALLAILAEQKVSLSFIQGVYVAAAGVLTFAVQTTYWKKGPDCAWYNWMMVGAANGLAFIPVSWIQDQWISLLYRTLFLMAFTPIWCSYLSNHMPGSDKKDGAVTWSEGGRGFIDIITLLFYLGR